MQLMHVQTSGASRMLTSLNKAYNSSKSLLFSQSALTLIKVHICRSYELMTIIPHRASTIFEDGI